MLCQNNSTIFRTINTDAKRLTEQFGLLGKSFRDIKKDFANGLGVKNSLFQTSISKSDWQSLQKFNSAIKVTNDGLTKSQRITKAWNENMTGCSMAAKRMGNDLITGKQKIGDVSNSMKTATASTKALGVAMNVFANVGFMLAITAVTKVITELAQAQSKAVEAAQEATEAYKGELTSLEEYKTKVSELHEELNSENISYEESKTIREELLVLQDELIQKYGNEKTAIENITTAIKGEVDALDELNEKAYRDWVAKADETTFWNISGKSGLDQAIDYMETDQTVSFYDMQNANLSDELQAIQKEIDETIRAKYGLEKQFATFKLTGTPEEIRKQLENIRQDYIDISENVFLREKLTGEWDKYREEAISSINEVLLKLDEGLGKHQETYQTYIEGMIKYDSEYSDEYANILQKRAELESAQSSGNQEEIQKAKQSFMDAINEGIASSSSNENVKKYFESLYPELQSEFSNWVFEFDLKANVKGLKDMAAEIGEQYTAVDLLDMVNTEGTQEGEDAFNSLIDKAIEYGVCTDNSAEEVQKLIDLLVELGIVQGNVQGSISDNEITVLPDISETIDNLNTRLKPTMDALKEAYQNIFKSEDGEINFSLDDVDISTFESIKSAIGELDEIEGIDIDYSSFDDFVKVLSDTSSTSDEVQDQFNKLATSIVYSSDCTEMSKDNFDLLVKSLYEMGLTNAREVLTNIKNAQEELKASGIDLKNVTSEEAQAFINEAESSDIAIQYLRMYMLQKELANGNQLDTTESIQSLKKLCEQLGMTCNALGQTSELMQAVLSLESANNAIASGVDYSGQYARQAETAKKKIEDIKNGNFEDYNYNFNSNVTSPSSSKGSSGSSDSNKPSEVTQEFNWIENYLESFARNTEKIMNRISDYLSFKKNLSTIKSAIKSVRSELSANQQALAEYEKQMNAVGLSQTYIDKIKNGELSIETIIGYETDGNKDANAQLIEKIEKYQDLYDKYTDIEDTIEDLRETEKEWLVKNLEYVNEYYQKLSDIKNLAIDKKQDNIDLKEAQGKKVTTSDYKKLVSNNSAYIKSLRTTYKKTNAEFNKLVKNGTIEKNSAEWFEWKETLAGLNSEIVQAKINTAEWKDEIEDLKIQKYTDAIDKLKIKNEELNDAISEREAIGLDVREKDYSAVVKNNNKQISQLEKQNALLYKYQSQVQKGSERWKEFQEQIDSNNSSIRQLNQSTTELIKNIANIPIEERDEDLEDSSNRLALLQKKYDNATSLQERKQILKLMEEEQKKQKEINEQAKNATKSNLSTSQNNLLSYKNNQQSIVQKAEGDVKSHETYISNQEKELEVLNNQEKFLNSKISALDKKIAKTKDKTLLKQLKKQKEKYENQLNSTKAQQIAISSDLELAKKDLAKSKEELATAQKNVSALSGFKEGEKMDTDGITDKDTLNMIKEYNLALEAYEQAEYDCAIADEEWTNQMRENAQNRLDIIKEEYEALIDLTNSYSDATNSLIDLRKLQGNVVGDELYESLINNSQKNVEYAYEEWQKHSQQMAENDYTNDPEGYQKALAENNRLQQAWYDSVKTAEEQLDNLMNTRIEALEEEKEKLQELHDLQERRYKLEEAKYNLEKAKQRTNLVYNGTEFVYQADTNAVKEAEKALEDAEYDELINKIEDWIKAIEDAKEDINLYDADGNPLTNIDEIIESAKAFGDNLLEGLSKLLENNGYTSGDLSKIQKFAEGGVVGKSDDDKFKAIAKSLGEDNLVAVKDGKMVLTKLQSNELYKKLVGTGTVPVPILDLKPVIPDNLVRVNTAPNIEIDMSGMQFNEVQNMDEFTREIQKMAQKASSMIDMELGKRKM